MTCCTWILRSSGASSTARSTSPAANVIVCAEAASSTRSRRDHICIGAASVEPNEQAGSAVRALQTTLAWYGPLGTRFETVLTDNGPAIAPASSPRQAARPASNTRHTKPYTHAPTERQNVSSRQRSENGLTLVPTTAQNRETTCLPNGSKPITGIDHTSLKHHPHQQSRPG